MANIHLFAIFGQSHATQLLSSIQAALVATIPGQFASVGSAHSGDPIQEWVNDPCQRGTNYPADLAAITTRINQVKAAGDTITDITIFWLQGEGDSGTGGGVDLDRVDRYYERVKCLTSLYTTDITPLCGIAPKFVLMGVRWQNPNDPDRSARGMEIRNIQKQVAKDCGLTFVDTNDLPRPDGVHIDVNLRPIAAQRFVDAALSGVDFPDCSVPCADSMGNCP